MVAKTLFRKFVIIQLKKQKSSYYKIDKILTKELKKELLSQQIKDIMLYLPLKNEVDIFPLILELKRRKKRVYVPYMRGESFILTPFRFPLQRKKFNIKEPKVSKRKIKTIDYALIPIIGIDKSCKRVGFGKGMYDRFFAHTKIKVKKKVFVVRELFVNNNIITNCYDIKADEIITKKVILTSF